MLGIMAAEVERGILAALQGCVGKLQQPEDAVRFTINWDQIQSLPDVGPAFLCSVLQQHISDLQPILAQLLALATSEKEKSDDEKNCQTIDVQSAEKVDSGSSSSKSIADKGLLQTSCLSDPAVVQIQAGKSEIDRRILAFIERKQAEINENNVREFCNVIDCNQENSCARTDAVFTPFPGFKSHIKVSRVVNAYGPQTRRSGSSAGTRVHTLQGDCGNASVEERLQSMECHLQLKPGGPVPKDIYLRIKKLEDRILELESISPEYFQSTDISSKRKKVQLSQRYSLVELDQKIDALRQSLYRKAKGESLDKMKYCAKH
ncbi:LOW QUALITY PROTEIN: MAP3K12-binding inhibitory protein 1 [Hyperolius riggenbachi]|uniref:LOW QUALITY PROTEIN: MAP3K12-binding inhibitory protein 1 n=1 Tax=Hyperolius riggenbachi TaxID=752182 RepID=UPI0035A2DAA6